jgi:Terminase RNaseH-like domain
MIRVGGVDPASGTKGGDRFGCAVATVNAEGVGILQGLRIWAPPFSPSVVVAEAAAWLKTYHVTEAVGDRYSGEFVRELFRAEGVRYEPTDRDKSRFFLDLLPLCNAGKVRLLDHPELLRELRGLERRIGKEGRDRVDHRAGAHDDAANAAAIALVLAVEASVRARKAVTPAAAAAWAESTGRLTQESYWRRG